MVPQLAGQSLFLEEVARLSPEQYETAHEFLAIWSTVNVKLAEHSLTDSEVSAIQRDFVTVAQYVPGSSFEELLDGLALASAKTPARKALSQASARAEKAEREAQRAREQAALDTVAGDTSNVVWPLHRILAGMDSMGLDDATVQRLQKKFGWTLSFSRAMHGGPHAMHKWFLQAGIDPDALEGLYQCFGQQGAGGTMVGAEVVSTPFQGIQRVDCSYTEDGKSRKLPTSLLMHAPLLQVSGGKTTSGLSEEDVSSLEANIPGVMPQLHGGAPKVTGFTVPVHSVPLVLTPPRIVLLMRMAECLTLGSSGMQLTGVHGAGKSVLLAALSTVLPVGHPCDMLYVSDASELLQGGNTCGAQLVQSSGPLVDGRALGTPLHEARHRTVLVTLKGNQRQAVRAWKEGHVPQRRQLASWYSATGTAMQRLLPATLGRLKDGAANVRCGRVYIFDEVNRLLKGMRDHVDQNGPNGANGDNAVDRASFNAFKRHLPWDIHYPQFCFRILASSPDGVREKVAEGENVFYELRPTRFDHLAAILHTAPHFVLPKIQNLHLEKGEHFISLQHAMRACRVLCGNMRRVTSYAAGIYGLHTKQAATVQADHDSESVTVTNAEALLEVSARVYIDTLVARMAATCANRDALKNQNGWEDNVPQPVGNVGMLPAAFYDLAAMNASMGVRQQPDDKAGRYDLLGTTMLDVLKKAVRNRDIVLSDPVHLHLFARLVMTTSEHYLANGEIMENEVKKRLSMQSLAARKWRLRDLAGFDGVPLPVTAETADDDGAKVWPMHQLRLNADGGTSAEPVSEDMKLLLGRAVCAPDNTWLPASQLQPDGAFIPQVADLLQSTGNARTRVDADTVHTGRKTLEDGGMALISTARQFPRADFLLLQSKGKRRSITFVEVTISTLAEHAKGGWYKGLPTSLKDLARLTEAEYLTAEHESGQWFVAGKASVVDGVRQKKKPNKNKKQKKGAQMKGKEIAASGAADEECDALIEGDEMDGSTDQYASPKALQQTLGDDWTLRGRETLANFWLRALGCPKRIVARIDGDRTSPKPECKLRITVEDAAPAATPSAADVEWDISIVYVSGSGEQPTYKDYRNLDCDFAYGVFQADLDSAVDDWIYMPQATVEAGPPHLAAFVEHTQGAGR